MIQEVSDYNVRGEDNIVRTRSLIRLVSVRWEEE